MSDDLSTFQYDLLAATHTLEPVHGLGIKNHLTTEHGYATVNHGRMYPNLDDLVSRGLVEKAERDGRTNEYTLTEAGRERLAERAAVLGGGSA
jgi:DNA-binding PadR family transcriptional regulator